jgi:hypothetical protein
MDEGKRNLLCDFVMSSVMGCAAFFVLIFISFMAAIAFLIILSIFK